MSTSARLRELINSQVIPTDRWAAKAPTPLHKVHPFPWPEPAAQELRDILTGSFSEKQVIIDLIKSVGMDSGWIDTSGSAKIIWHNVIGAAVNQGRLLALVEAAAQELEHAIPQQRCQICGRQVTGEKSCRPCRGAPSRLVELLPVTPGTLGHKVVHHLSKFLDQAKYEFPSENEKNATVILNALAKLEDDGLDAFLLRLSGHPAQVGKTSVEPLVKLLVQAYSSTSTARYCALGVGINLDRVDQHGAIDPLWRGILEAAEAQGKLRALVRAALTDPLIAGFHTNIQKWADSQGW